MPNHMLRFAQRFLTWIHARPHRFPIAAGITSISLPPCLSSLLVAFDLHQNGALLIFLSGVIAAVITIPVAYANFQRARFTENQRRALSRAATTDPLTASLNRRSFCAAVEAEQARMPAPHTLSFLILFDLDHFKTVNDTYGHDVGDRVLKAVAETARAHIRSGSDYMARWGGEEFAIFLRGADAQAAMAFAERLRQAFETLELPDCPEAVRVTASFGLSPVTTDRDLDDAFREADRALYSAKRAGRNQSVAATGARVFAVA